MRKNEREWFLRNDTKGCPLASTGTDIFVHMNTYMHMQKGDPKDAKPHGVGQSIQRLRIKHAE